MVWVVGDTNLPLLLVSTSVTCDVLQQYIERTYPTARWTSKVIQSRQTEIELVTNHLAAKGILLRLQAGHAFCMASMMPPREAAAQDRVCQGLQHGEPGAGTRQLARAGAAGILSQVQAVRRANRYWSASCRVLIDRPLMRFEAGAGIRVGLVGQRGGEAVGRGRGSSHGGAKTMVGDPIAVSAPNGAQVSARPIRHPTSETMIRSAGAVRSRNAGRSWTQIRVVG
jgi:hypothetical protein